MSFVWFALGALAGVALTLFVYFPSIRRTRRKLAALQYSVGKLKPFAQRSLQLDWMLWWLRNAVECPESDHTRPALIRFALAATLEPGLDFGAHVARLHRLAEDPATVDADRSAARCFVSEWQHAQESQRLPWTAWEQTGKPRWNVFAQKRAYEAALQSWNALIPGALSPGACEAPLNRSDHH